LIKKSFDNIGGAGLIKKSFDNIGGSGLIKKSFDNIGGSGLIRSVDKTGGSQLTKQHQNLDGDYDEIAAWLLYMQTKG